MTKTSCPLPSHDATPLAAAAPDLTTPASGPHHTPLTTGAMTHHTVGGEDIGQVLAGDKEEKKQKIKFLSFNLHYVQTFSQPLTHKVLDEDIHINENSNIYIFIKKKSFQNELGPVVFNNNK